MRPRRSPGPGLDAVRASLGRPAGAICRSGCSACCVGPVQVAVEEIARLAPLLDAGAWERVLALRGSGRGVPCPLLNVAGACSIYGERPIACRALWQHDLTADCSRLTTISPSLELLAWGRLQSTVYLIEGLQAWRRCQPASAPT